MSDCPTCGGCGYEVVIEADRMSETRQAAAELYRAVMNRHMSDEHAIDAIKNALTAARSGGRSEGLREAAGAADSRANATDGMFFGIFHSFANTLRGWADPAPGVVPPEAER